MEHRYVIARAYIARISISTNAVQGIGYTILIALRAIMCLKGILVAWVARDTNTLYTRCKEILCIWGVRRYCIW